MKVCEKEAAFADCPSKDCQSFFKGKLVYMVSRVDCDYSTANIEHFDSLSLALSSFSAVLASGGLHRQEPAAAGEIR
jgi:hypothetical protein